MNKFIYYIAIFVMFFCCKLIKMLLKLPLPPLSVGITPLYCQDCSKIFDALAFFSNKCTY